MTSIETIFTNLGGSFLIPVDELQRRLEKIRAYIFDWDGVFNNGIKNEEGSSAFSEVDAMGTNLLRFSHYLHHRAMPVTSVMSGEKNISSFQYGNREHIHDIYFRVKNKKLAFDHFIAKHGLAQEEVLFIFDDVLDLSLARNCGVRICVGRSANPLFLGYVRNNDLADYITGNAGESHAVRETCELLMGLRKNFQDAVHHRSHYTEEYAQYFASRQELTVSFHTWDGKQIIAADPA